MLPAAFAESAALRANKLMLLASLVALLNAIAAPLLLSVFTDNALVAMPPEDCETAPVLVSEKLPAPVETLPAKSTVPVLLIETLPPPAWLMPVMLKAPLLTKLISPLVIFVPLKLAITLALFNVVP